MTKKIFEELPARKNAPAAAPVAAKGANSGGAEGSEKRIRQAVYDIRYRARREGIDLRAAYSQYMQNSNLSAPEQTAVRAKLFGKDGGGGEKKEVKEERTAADPGMKARMGYDKYKKPPMPKKEKPKGNYGAKMTEGATTSVANAMFKVFVEDAKEQEFVYEDESSDRKYKVRVTDEKTGRSYVRYADRAKITALRSKGLKVEMTEHGEPVGERAKKGGMDPVAKNPAARDGDVNNDGRKDKTDKYIYNRRDAINAAIAKKKGMQEELLLDGTTSTEGQNKGKITGTGVDNYSTGIVKVMPENGADIGKMNKMRRGIYAHTEVEMSASQRRLMEMIAEKKKSDKCAHNNEGEECSVHGMKACPDSVSEGMGGDCGPEDKDKKDMRADRTYREVLKNKLRSMGKKVLAATGEDAEDSYEKMATASFVKMNKMTGKMEPVSLYGEAMVMIADSLISEGYSEDQIFDAIDSLNEEQVQQLDEGLSALAKFGVRALSKVPGVKGVITKGTRILKGVMGKGKPTAGKSAISQRASNVVGDQRLGVHGTMDDLNQLQKSAQSSLDKLNKSRANDAVRAATREKNRLNNLDGRAVSDANKRREAAQVMQRNRELGRPSWYDPNNPGSEAALKRYYRQKREGVRGLPE